MPRSRSPLRHWWDGYGCDLRRWTDRLDGARSDVITACCRRLKEDRPLFKTIIVAVDGSAVSNFGLEEAILLASEQQATLCVLHVVEEYVLAQSVDAPVYVEGLWEALREAGKKTLAKAVANAEQRGVTTRSILAESVGEPVADVILGQARKCRADLIVLGTHGRRGMSRLVMGSDAEAVIREATVPVLLVRTRRTKQRAGATRAARR